jgi:hypothetical protein
VLATAEQQVITAASDEAVNALQAAEGTGLANGARATIQALAAFFVTRER